MNCHVLFPPLITSRLQVCLKLPSLMYVFFLISLLDSHYEILYVKSFCIYSAICYLVAKPLSKKIPMSELKILLKYFTRQINVKCCYRKPRFIQAWQRGEMGLSRGGSQEGKETLGRLRQWTVHLLGGGRRQLYFRRSVHLRPYGGISLAAARTLGVFYLHTHG